MNYICILPIVSDPTSVDSDGDQFPDKYLESMTSGYYQFDDPNPLKSDVTITELEHDFFSVDYVMPDGAPGNWANEENDYVTASYGGNQCWFNYYGNTGEEYIFCNSTVSGQCIQENACGLIAATDFTIYSLLSNDVHEVTYFGDSIVFNEKGSFTNVQFSSYTKFVTYLSNYIQIYGKLGAPAVIVPESVYEGLWMENILFGLDYSYTWAPGSVLYVSSNYEYCDFILIKMKHMIDHDIPVIFSYDVYSKDYSYKLLILDSDMKYKTYFESGFTSHYMTATGMIEYSDDVCRFVGHSTLIQLSSWGKKYYFDYDIYSEHLSLTNNIMIAEICNE